MASLTGTLISSTYPGLLKFADNAAITSVTKSITDGDGNATPLSIAANLLKISGSTTVTGSIEISSMTSPSHTNISGDSITTANHADEIGFYVDLYGIELYSGSNFLDVTVAGNAFGDNRDGGVIAVSDNLGNGTAVIGFQNYDNWVDGTVSILTPLQAISGSQITGSLKVSGSIQMSASSSFVLPLRQPTSPVKGTAFFSGSFLYIYNGSAFVSASLF